MDQEKSVNQALGEFSVALAAAMDSTRWPTDWDTDEAEFMYYRACTQISLEYQASGELESWVKGMSELEGFNQAWFANTPVPRRMNALQGLHHIGSGNPPYPAYAMIWPFIELDQDDYILSWASIYYSVLDPILADDDELRAGKRVVECALRRQAEGELEAAGALCGGLLGMGDERFISLLRQAWPSLERPAAMRMVSTPSKMASDAHVGFLVDTLETTNDADLFTALGDALVALSKSADELGVLSIERVIPVFQSPQEPFKILGHWSKREYTKTLLPRLQQLAARNAETEAMLSESIHSWSTM